MTAHRLSRPQHRVMDWLAQEEQGTSDTMSTEYHALVLAMDVDKGNLRTSLKSLERKRLIRVQRPLGGKVEVIDLTPAGEHKWKM
jgi:DNA-binding MarR family transcriptional regulator